MAEIACAVFAYGSFLKVPEDKPRNDTQADHVRVSSPSRHLTMETSLFFAYWNCKNCKSGVDSGIWPGHLHRQPILPYPKLVIPIPIVTIHSSECWSCLFSHPGGYMRNSMAWSKPGTTYMASAVTSARTLPYKPTRTRKFGSMANLQSSMCLVPGGEAELQVSRL
ncbi:hypothetical protein M404DRAFT_246390 [Pisolithus tinctorius Marx 270]|uniref:Uncharacterized protein n=1 Tax=Pisolithus tinctorius Marx 270 TaxID=870435 RepID=A0A0C3N5R7_PISTI|nr:hypothetical protein M404DRAFT_246390 [Pisolithus tinctorius Marx 270]